MLLAERHQVRCRIVERSASTEKQLPVARLFPRAVDVMNVDSFALALRPVHRYELAHGVTAKFEASDAEDPAPLAAGIPALVRMTRCAKRSPRR